MALKLVLVSAIVALIRSQVSSSESAIVVRGIHPSLTALYQSGGPQTPFQCLDGSKTLPFHQVNDDYCDCQVRPSLPS